MSRKSASEARATVLGRAESPLDTRLAASTGAQLPEQGFRSALTWQAARAPGSATHAPRCELLVGAREEGHQSLEADVQRVGVAVRGGFVAHGACTRARVRNAQDGAARGGGAPKSDSGDALMSPAPAAAAVTAA